MNQVNNSDRRQTVSGRLRLILVAAIAILAHPAACQTTAAAPQVRTADIGNGINLHYVEEGQGVPVIFVHGSLSDGSYWSDQVPEFAKHYRAIAYSRRYNYPNENPARPGYSAVTDADDLAGLVRSLHLGKVVVIGHSYGGLTALFFAVRHPEMVRALVVAEAPAVSLLAHDSGPEAKTARQMYDDIEQRMVKPMQEEFRRGDREAGVATFIDYVFHDPKAWEKMPASSKQETLRDAHEWDVMMTSGTLFTELSPEAVRKIHVPVLLMTGAKSYPFLVEISRELRRLLPNSETVVFPDSGHQMWMQHPEECRTDVEQFLAKHGIAAAKEVSRFHSFKANDTGIPH